jgi:amidase
MIRWIDTNEGDTDPSEVHKVESQIVTDLLSLGAVMYCKVSCSMKIVPTWF